MYKIMLKTADTVPTYRYKTEVVEGVSKDVEFETLGDLDVYVENMLNNDYAKKDFIIVEPLDFTIFADIAENPIIDPDTGNGNNSSTSDPTDPDSGDTSTGGGDPTTSGDGTDPGTTTP